MYTVIIHTFGGYSVGTFSEIIAANRYCKEMRQIDSFAALYCYDPKGSLILRMAAE